MDAQKLAKVLALAASDNESEAVHALRTARRLLEAAGLDFVAIAGLLATSPAAAALSQAAVEDLEDAVFDLRNEVRHLRGENERLRQNRPVAGGSLAGAAEAVAADIRLRAELAQAREEAEAERLRAGAALNLEAALRTRAAEATALAERLAAQLEQVSGRKDRLEAEHRRLGHVAQALKAELTELAAKPEPARHSEPRRMPAAAPRRGKAAPASQYALF
jgi:chromosome segregation ATPase